MTHRVKSINNPDKRVTLVKEFVQDNFPKCPMLEYALQVEKITTSKKPNLILNVDGCIAVSFVDLLRNRLVASVASYLRKRSIEFTKSP